MEYAVAQTMGMTIFSLASIFYALETNDESALGLQPGDAREPPVAADVRLVAAGDVPGDRAGLHAKPLRDDQSEYRAVDHLHRGRLGDPVGDRDREDFPATSWAASAEPETTATAQKAA